MHCSDNVNTHVFLTKGEHDQLLDENDGFMLETDDMLSSEMEEFKKGYHNAIMQFQNQYNLRSKKTSADPRMGCQCGTYVTRRGCKESNMAMAM
jgi:hypothetical protein